MSTSYERDFGLREFELALLDSMYDEAPIQTEAALHALDANRAEASAAEERRLQIAPCSVADYTRWLGQPVSREPYSENDRGGMWTRWALSTWPYLWFEMLELPKCSLFNVWLTRRDGAPAPRLETAADLAPWSCTHKEVELRFGPTLNVDGFHTSWLLMEFSAPDSTGRTRRYEACFVWGLLQHVRERNQQLA
ncbi:hypothetical protein ACRYCC_07660 [Actinomadura scrupuli]|uniref:hypothetical protein n=1 Tax=Actinomadura scrupuli TaxID=559629 RepID=UPI003D975FBD